MSAPESTVDREFRAVRRQVLLALALGPLSFVAVYIFLRSAFVSFPPPDTQSAIAALASSGLALSNVSFVVATAMIAVSLASVALLSTIPAGTPFAERAKQRSFRWRIGCAVLPMGIAGMSMSAALATTFYDAPISANPTLYTNTWPLLAADWVLMTLLFWQILLVILLAYVVVSGILPTLQTKNRTK
ncbi:MAG: hypothetical protein ACLP8Y_02770 [Thermoplasmata archaeon]